MNKDKEAARLGRLGGIKTLKKYGPDYFRKMALKRWKNKKKK